MTTREAEEMLDEAIYADQHNGEFTVPSYDEIDQIGVMNFHKVYYDGGWSTHKIVDKVLKQKPKGNLALILNMVIQARVAKDDYSEETLKRMYNLGK